MLLRPFRLFGWLLSATAIALVAAHAQTSTATQRQRAAIQKACASGAMSADECQQRLAALNGSGGQTAPQQQSSGMAGMNGGNGGGQQWREPHGRYTIAIPAGWQVDESSGNLKITQGTNWATFDTMSRPGQPLAVAQSEADQMKTFTRDWRVVNQGAFAGPNGHPAGGVTATGQVATRSGYQQQTFLFVALAAGGGNYVVMNSSSTASDGAAINAFMAALQSVRFGNE